MPATNRLDLLRSRAAQFRACARASESEYWRAHWESQALTLEREAATLAAQAVVKR